MRYVFLTLVVLVSACGPDAQTARKTAPTERPSVGQAKLAAESIAGKKCETVDLQRDLTSGTITIQINCPESHQLAVPISHMHYREYYDLQASKPRPIKFQYSPTGFNEASISAPENDENPAFYLDPIDDPS